MKKITQQMEERLLNYLDGSLSDVERQHVEDDLKQDESLRLRLEELHAVNTLLKELKIEQPSRNFASSVMDRLDQLPDTKNVSLKSSLLLLTGILMAIGAAALLVSTGVFDGAHTIVDLNKIDSIRQYVNLSLPAFTIQGKLIVNTIIFLNVAIALVVLDRAILKPLFRRRMEM